MSQIRTPETDGYSAVQLAFGWPSTRLGQQARRRTLLPRPGVTPRRDMVELRTEDASEYTLGQEPGRCLRRGRPGRCDRHQQGQGGFAGVMKRHGFPACAPATVCTACTARRVRSVVAPLGPGFPGLNMAGRMGSDRVTTQALKVQSVDAERNLILIKAPCPAKGCAGAYPRHREGRMTMTSIDIKTPRR